VTTLKNLLSQLAAERARASERAIERKGALDGHRGFGQEPVPPKRTRPPNTALAFFVMKHFRAPHDQAELDAFTKAREATERKLQDE
jgi:hypothetical protein